MKYTFKSTERINGKFLTANFETKISIRPLQLYLLKKETGQEVLFNEGLNNNEVLVNPNGFPFINLSFNPNGSIMRKDAHHTIFETGFRFMSNIIEESLKKTNNELYKFITINGETVFDKRTCLKLTMDYTDFGYYKYTIERNQMLNELAQKLNLNEAMIAEKNGIELNEKLIKGDQILIPNLYAKKIIMLIEKSSVLPINITVYDDKGVFEEYGFYNLKINPEIRKEEFSEDFKDYGF